MEQIFSIKAKEKMQASTQEQSVGSALVSGLNKKKKNNLYIASITGNFDYE